MFEDIGHSKEARNVMAKWVIGKLKGGVAPAGTKTTTKEATEIKSKGGLNPLVVLVVLIAIALGIFFSQQK
jgi:hypothetical protein